jgi:hypothetical protein
MYHTKNLLFMFVVCFFLVLPNKIFANCIGSVGREKHPYYSFMPFPKFRYHDLLKKKATIENIKQSLGIIPSIKTGKSTTGLFDDDTRLSPDYTLCFSEKEVAEIDLALDVVIENKIKYNGLLDDVKFIFNFSEEDQSIRHGCIYIIYQLDTVTELNKYARRFLSYSKAPYDNSTKRDILYLTIEKGQLFGYAFLFEVFIDNDPFDKEIRKATGYKLEKELLKKYEPYNGQIYNKAGDKINTKKLWKEIKEKLRKNKEEYLESVKNGG